MAGGSLSRCAQLWSWTTATGQVARCSTPWLTEPSSMVRSAPRPRQPTTSSRASFAAAASARTGCSCTSRRLTSTSGYFSAQPGHRLRERPFLHPLVVERVVHERHRGPHHRRGKRVHPGIDGDEGLAQVRRLLERVADGAERDRRAVDADDDAASVAGGGVLGLQGGDGDHGAVRALRHVHRRGAGDQCRESGRAVGPDHHGVGVQRLLDEGDRSVVVDQVAGHGELRVRLDHPLGRRVEHSLGIRDVVLQQPGPERTTDADVVHGRLEGVHQPYRGVPADGEVEAPAEGAVGAG